MHLDDKIVVAFGGPIGAGKKAITKACEDYSPSLLDTLQGNLWVPQEVHVIRDPLDKELFAKYSADRETYASQFQFSCLAAREEAQSRVEQSRGIVILGQNYEADRAVYAEANKVAMGEFFKIYDKLNRQIAPKSLKPDIHVYCKITDVDTLKAKIAARDKPEERWLLTHENYLGEIIRLNEQFYDQKREIAHVIDIDCSDEFSTEGLQTAVDKIANGIRQYNPPLRLDLEVWNKLEFIQAMQGKREAQRQLTSYLGSRQVIINTAGNVATSKTTFAEFLAGELGINIARELRGKNNDLSGDDLLSKFLMNKLKYCYALQDQLVPSRKGGFMQGVNSGKSFVSDRTAGEDAFVFHRRFREQGFLTEKQQSDLLMRTIATYQDVPQANLMVKLMASAAHSRKMVLERGRPEEIFAWPKSELEELAKFYSDLEAQFKTHNLHSGPTVSFDVEEVNIKNAVHQGYVFQEVLLTLLENNSPK
jgi:deoxyadenosine/deoxycytidine kinase